MADFLQARLDAEEPTEEEPVPPEEVPADATTESFSPKVKRMIRDELRKAARAMTASSRRRVQMDEHYIDALAVDNLESDDLIQSIARQLEL